MDSLLYRRYQRDGGTETPWNWESAEGLDSWDHAPSPGQLGRKVERLIIRRPPPDEWARGTTNAVHWATGIGCSLWRRDRCRVRNPRSLKTRQVNVYDVFERIPMPVNPASDDRWGQRMAERRTDHHRRSSRQGRCRQLRNLHVCQLDPNPAHCASVGRSL